MDYAADLSARIACAIAHGATVSQIARELGLDRAYISRILHRRQKLAPLDTASRIASWCDTLVERRRKAVD